MFQSPNERKYILCNSIIVVTRPEPVDQQVSYSLIRFIFIHIEIFVKLKFSKNYSEANKRNTTHVVIKTHDYPNVYS